MRPRLASTPALRTTVSGQRILCTIVDQENAGDTSISINSFVMNKRKSALCRGISCYLLVNQVQNICPSYLLCFSFPYLHSLTRSESSLRENEFGFAKGLFLHYTRFVTKSNRKFIIISLCFCRECLHSSVELVQLEVEQTFKLHYSSRPIRRRIFY